MHRVRHLAWELPKLGWEVELLYPNLDFQRAEYVEPEPGELFNPSASTHPVAPRDFWFFRLGGIRSIGWRALRPLRHAGDVLLCQKRIDLVFISTANFNLFCLGRWWKRRFGVPYVLDYHDPWIRDRIDYSTTESRVKRWLAALLARGMERLAIEGAGGVVSVSPVYIEELRKRYGSLVCLEPRHCEAIPFAGSDRDFGNEDHARSSPPDGALDIVYVGAGGSIMARSFRTLCQVLAATRSASPQLFESIRITLYGTYAYWKDGQQKLLQEIALQFGLSDVVVEMPARIPYREAMRSIKRSSGLLLLGVDDEGYMPSKLFTYALSGKPLLASLRAESVPSRLFLDRPGLGHLITFGACDEAEPDAATGPARAFLTEVRERRCFDRRPIIEDFLAPAMAARHAALFERVCNEQGVHASQPIRAE
jgi:glycosyltransferase involved in cell wall biosynthesis